MPTLAHCSSPEIAHFIKGNCKLLLGPSFWDSRYISRIEVGWKPERTDSRILVLSKYRLFFLSGKTTAKLQVESSLHLLSVTAVEVASDVEQVRCVLEDGRKLYLCMGEEGNTAIDLAMHILQAFKHYFPSCNDNLKFFLDLNPPQLYAEFAKLPNSRPSLPCENFRRTYAALCDFYKLPFRDEVGWDIDKIYSCHYSTVLRLEDFSHLFPKDLIPIVAVLQFNSWFSGLSIENLKVGADLQEIIIYVLKKSQWLKILRLKNCGLKSDFIHAMASALRVNAAIPLECLDIAKNNFDDPKALVQLGNVLPLLGKSLSEVRFVDCNLNSKAVNGIASGLFRCQLTSASLRKISFAHNALKDDVADVHNLMSHCERLQELDLSHSALPLDKLWTPLKYGGLQLEILKLNGCCFSGKKNKEGGVPAGLKDFFASAISLRHLDLSDSILPPDCLKALLLGLACNTEITKVHLDLSRTLSEKGVVPVLEFSLPNVRAIRSLSLRDNGLEGDLASLLPAIGRMPCLMRLDLSGSNFNSLRKHAKQLPAVLMELVKIINEEDGSLRELLLSDCKLGVHLSVLLNALGPSPSLTFLDVSGNEIGNFGARLMAKALQINSSLRTILLDRNQITSEGYADIAYALQENFSVSWIPCPLNDAADCTARGDKERTQFALLEIEKLTRRNQGSSKPAKKCEGRASAEKGAEPLNQSVTKSRLGLANVEEELNRAVYAGQTACQDSKSTDTPDYLELKKLIEDAENSKKLLEGVKDRDTSTDFLDELLNGFENQIENEFRSRLAEATSYVLESNQLPTINVLNEQEFGDTVRVQGRKKLESADVENIVRTLKQSLEQEFLTVASSSVYAMIGTLMTELTQRLHNGAKRLTTSNRSSSQTSLDRPSTATTTPKSSKKFKAKLLGSRTSRPKSIVEGEGISSQHMELSSSEEVFAGGDTESIDSADMIGANNLNDSGIDFLPTAEGKKLVHVVKARPKNPRKRYQKPTPATGVDDKSSDHTTGIDQFFSPSASRKEAVGLQTVMETEEASEKQSSPLTPLVPPITTDMLRGTTLKATSESPNPRAPPNTPATPFNFSRDSLMDKSGPPLSSNSTLNESGGKPKLPAKPSKPLLPPAKPKPAIKPVDEATPPSPSQEEDSLLDLVKKSLTVSLSASEHMDSRRATTKDELSPAAAPSSEATTETNETATEKGSMTGGDSSQNRTTLMTTSEVETRSSLTGTALSSTTDSVLTTSKSSHSESEGDDTKTELSQLSQTEENGATGTDGEGSPRAMPRRHRISPTEPPSLTLNNTAEKLNNSQNSVQVQMRKDLPNRPPKPENMEVEEGDSAIDHRKSVVDLKHMFEKGPSNNPDRPVPVSRGPSRHKIAPADRK